MIKFNTILFLLFSLVFIFSCNTEAKFGFRKKVKVENHTIAQTTTKPHVTKTEIKVDKIDTCEIITASVADEKIISAQIPQYKTSNSINKIFTDSINQKKKNDEPRSEKELNISAVIGLIFGMIDLIGFIRIFFLLANPAEVILLLCFLSLVGIAAAIFSVIGLTQINSNSEKEKGRGIAIFGLTFGLLAVCFFYFALFIMYMLSTGP